LKEVKKQKETELYAYNKLQCRIPLANARTLSRVCNLLISSILFKYKYLMKLKPINIDEFKQELQKIKTVESITKKTYSSIQVNGDTIQFLREDKTKFESISITELFQFYKQEKVINTSIAKTYISGRVQSPAVAILNELNIKLMKDTYQEIIIEWEGPFTAEEIKDKKGETDFGVYQVYGNHRIYGSNVLLYVGKAEKQTFGVRIPQHSEWFEWKENQQTYFLGKLCGLEHLSIEKWESQIDLAETYLIDHCQPAWNSKSLNIYISNYEKAHIYNHGNKASLPPFLPIAEAPEKHEYSNYKVFSTDNVVAL